MIYKTLKKVSNVCQLLDKSKYTATQTINGVTFTNNGDGSITVNGTATNRAVNTYVIYTKTRLSGKVLLTGCPSGGSSTTYYNYVYTRKSNGGWITGDSDYGNGCFLNYGITAYNILCQIIIEKGTVCNNLVFKPQLFDLTEMYGAGNEPTTVEQFRQDFPDELYDYKPYCFVKSYKTLLKASDNKIITSYKKSLICTTKNLIGNNQVYKLEDSTDKIIWQGEISERCVFSWYQLLNSLEDPSSALFQFNYSDGSIQYAGAKMELISRGYFFINRSASKKLTSIILLNWGLAKGSLYNLQLELGDTATEYHPYGYL